MSNIILESFATAFGFAVPTVLQVNRFTVLNSMNFLENLATVCAMCIVCSTHCVHIHCTLDRMVHNFCKCISNTH